MRRYYNMEQSGESAEIWIYGDIVSYPDKEWGEVSAYNLSQQIAQLKAREIRVYISSRGGEVEQGLAIYNALKRHGARVITYADSFVCSIASVIFMAGEERVMSESSALMIHNVWTAARGDAETLRKTADDLEKINRLSADAYLAHINIGEGRLAELLDSETWILPGEAVKMGFATKVETGQPDSMAAAGVWQAMMRRAAQGPGPLDGIHAEGLEQLLSRQLAPVLSALERMEKGPQKTPPQKENKPVKFLNALMK